MDHLHTLEIQNLRKDAAIQDLEVENNNKDAAIHDLKVKLDNITAKQQAEIQNLKSQMSLMTSDVTRLKHVESGEVRCDVNSDTWSGVDGRDVTTNEQTVRFKQSYTTAPIVHLGLRLYDDHSTTTNYVYFHVSHVDINTFTVRCGKLKILPRIWQLYLTWISVPNI